MAQALSANTAAAVPKTVLTFRVIMIVSKVLGRTPLGVSRSGPLRLRRSEGRIYRISMESADGGRTPRVRNDRRRVDAGCVWRFESNMARACEAVAPARRRTLRLLVASNPAVPIRFNDRLLRRLSRSRTGHGRNGETGYDDERHRMHPDTQRGEHEAQEVSRFRTLLGHSQA